MVREILRKIGLSDEEVNIYLLLLKKGNSKATTISKELGVARTTIYRFLSSLHEKGLIGENIQNNVKYFYPVNPERIPEIIEERAEEAKEIVPKLTSLQRGIEDEARVELFKGKEGIKSIMRDILRERKPYTFLGEAEKYFSEIEIFVIQWLRKVEAKKVHGKLLCSKDQKFKIARTEKYKLLSHDLIPEISVWTYGNKTALMIFSDPPYAILINNKQVTSGNKKTFDYFWTIARNPTEEHLKQTKL